jgi:hypothetical protein
MRIAARVVHAEVALTSSLPLQHELKKVTLNQSLCRYCIPKEHQQPETSATKADKAIAVITPVPHRAVATLQAPALELWR